jgi:hypothetical protein
MSLDAEAIKQEKKRREALHDKLVVGMVLEFIKDDFHEEDVTPLGFHRTGDQITLLAITSVRPIITHPRFGAPREVGSYNVWLIKSPWGELERDALYLSAMCKEAM